MLKRATRLFLWMNNLPLNDLFNPRQSTITQILNESRSNAIMLVIGGTISHLTTLNIRTAINEMANHKFSNALCLATQAA